MSDDKGPQSTGDMLRGSGSNDGLRHVTAGGASITTGPAKDTKYEGGKYVSVTDAKGNKQTNVYDANGNLVKKS
jgi:YD repeat-containing protein